MLRACYLREILDDVIVELTNKDVDYTKWTSNQDEVEIRVDLTQLDTKQLEFMYCKYGSEIDSYDYLIFWW